MNTKDKYWAKKIYSKLNPLEYEIKRFSSPAGRLIDEAEKKCVFELLMDSRAKNKKNQYILDVATGTGRLAFYIKDHFPSVQITGVDINKNMLAYAKKNIDKNIKFIIGDIYHLPFNDEQFDTVVGLRFSMHMPDLDKVLHELARILKVGGILIFDIFNINSILCLKSLLRKEKRADFGFYKKQEIVAKAKKNGLVFLSEKGILLFGETLLRSLPYQLLNFADPIINPPLLLKSISTKLILSFRRDI